MSSTLGGYFKRHLGKSKVETYSGSPSSGPYLNVQILGMSKVIIL